MIGEKGSLGGFGGMMGTWANVMKAGFARFKYLVIRLLRD